MQTTWGHTHAKTDRTQLFNKGKDSVSWWIYAQDELSETYHYREPVPKGIWSNVRDVWWVAEDIRPLVTLCLFQWKRYWYSGERIKVQCFIRENPKQQSPPTDRDQNEKESPSVFHWIPTFMCSHKVRHHFSEKTVAQCDTFLRAVMTGLSRRETETNITSELQTRPPRRQRSVHRVCPGGNSFLPLSLSEQTGVVSVGSYHDIFVCFNNGKIPLLWTHAQTARGSELRAETRAGLSRGPDKVEIKSRKTKQVGGSLKPNKKKKKKQ